MAELKFTFNDVFEALCAHPGSDAGWRSHAWTRIDLDQPWIEVLREHEVGAEQLEAVSSAVHVLLRGQQRAYDTLTHPRVYDCIP